MKTAMQEAIKEIAELCSSPSDTPTYTQIFKVLGSKLEKEKEQIETVFNDGANWELYGSNITQKQRAEKYYNEIFNI